MSTLLNDIAAQIGQSNVLTGADMAPFLHDWTGVYTSTPLAVLRPANTAEAAFIMQAAFASGTPVVPVSGNTGLAGGAVARDALMISLSRMNRLREIRPEARLAIVEAGVILANIHQAADAHDLIFPLMFGARGSAMIGGALSTNAGGSNVLRYGNTRALCLGLEVVLPNGEILNIMSQLHKDNSGYDLKDLFIGAEGTLGLITAATLKLFPKPKAYATAMVAVPSLDNALGLLNQLQEVSGGAVEAFEYMPANYVQRHLDHFPKARPPFDKRYDINILVEIGATAPDAANPMDDGRIPVVSQLENTLNDLFQTGAILDAVVARSDAQRTEMWARREAAAEITLGAVPIINADVAVPLDQVATFLSRTEAATKALDPDAGTMAIAHLGDGNVHFTVTPSRASATLSSAIVEAMETVVADLGGSFSAEHGIGLTKRPSMARRKDPVALAVMRQIKSTLDPKGIMNPGKVLPD